jgi:transketolase
MAPTRLRREAGKVTNHQLMANSLRMLAIDAVNAANSGHPGMPMGMADIATVLWHDFLQFDPKAPTWFGRDRFILSNGHGSMLQYALLHLTGFDLSLNELKNFRQLHSKTPGHPELGHTAGVETTTGPLGQGLANGIGMALAARILAATFNKPEFKLVDNYTYVFVGDGCLMEGISHEACSLAGTLKLNKLIVIYDDNGISIDGKVDAWFSEDVASRFRAYDWEVIHGVDGHNHKEITHAIKAAQGKDKPVLIMCKTQIGFGSPNFVGTAKSHGAPLGSAERALTAETLGWHAEPFIIADEIYRAWDATAVGAARSSAWQKMFTAYQQRYPELAAEFTRRIAGELPNDWSKLCTKFISEMQNIGDKATRQSSAAWLALAQKHLPELIGGSADLTGSNGTLFPGAVMQAPQNPAGNYIEYGVREFGMAAIMNGMAAYGGVLPYAGTFLVFSDYSKNALRMSAIMHLKVIHVLTHDSFMLGEDGPTHQPVEHLAALRAIPNLDTWRPADCVEVAISWQEALAHRGPSALCLTRQTLKNNAYTAEQIANIKQGAYILADAENFTAIIIATGSEVELAIAAQQELLQQKIKVRVVSMPCMERFLRADKHYQQQVLPAGKKVFAIEAASSMPWFRFASGAEYIIALDEFGASAPAEILQEHFGFTVKNLVQKVGAHL